MADIAKAIAETKLRAALAKAGKSKNDSDRLITALDEYLISPTDANFSMAADLATVIAAVDEDAVIDYLGKVASTENQAMHALFLLPHIHFKVGSLHRTLYRMLDVTSQRRVEERWKQTGHAALLPALEEYTLGVPGQPYDRLPASTMVPLVKGDYTPVASKEVKALQLTCTSEAMAAVDEYYKRLQRGWQCDMCGPNDMQYNGWTYGFAAAHEKKIGKPTDESIKMKNK